MSATELKIKTREILIANPEMLACLDDEFRFLLISDPDFNYAEDEFLFWLVDFFIETESGQDNYHWN